MMECDNLIVRMLLANDGSMSILLEVLMKSKLKAVVIDSQVLVSCEFFDFPVIRREVVLECNAKRLVHAVSYISQEFFTKMGFSEGNPIGLAMIKEKIEQFRDIYSISYPLISESLSNLLQIPIQQLYTRSYYISIKGNPKIHITEILLPDLISLIT